MKPIKSLLLVICCAAALTGASCHSSRKSVRGSGGEIVTGDSRTSVDAAVARSLVDCARGWLGTPYRYGGNDRNGIDCSGLTCNVFSQGAGVSIPRDSRSQRDYCREIDRRALQPGDLVFFVNTPGGRRVNHVGLYIGGGEMIHASSSRGVMVSDITTGYWANHYYGSGRVEAVTYAARGTRPGKSERIERPEEPQQAQTQPQPQTPRRVDDGPTVRVPRPVAEIHFSALPTATEPDSVLQSWMD